MPGRNRGAAGHAGDSRALREFFASETAGGLMLVAAAAVALVWANSPWHESYATLWHTAAGVHIGEHGLDLDLREWVNDGLMAIFFLVVGLEVKRELTQGELRDRRQAALPIAAALGGMIVPAAIYMVANRTGSALHGWGIPMATDIAFALGVLALVAPRIPGGVRLFLLTLAIADDIGAIVVIAIFYTGDLDVRALTVAAGVLVAIVVLRRAGVVATPLYVIGGIVLWLALHESGVHATLAGVAMGLLAPATPALTREIVHSRGNELLDVFTPAAARETTRIARRAVSELEWLEHQLHGWSSFVIVPLFALANAGVHLTGESVTAAASSTITWGVIAGLVAGKTVGITAGAWLSHRVGIAELPAQTRWRHIVGAGALGGIGFTVSLFITNLAFDDPRLVDEAKVAVLTASVVAASLGALVLHGADRSDQ